MTDSEREAAGGLRAWWGQLVVLVTLASAAGVAHYRIGQAETDLRIMEQRLHTHVEQPGHGDSISRLARVEQRLDRQDAHIASWSSSVEAELRAVRESIVQLCTALRVNCRQR